MKTKNKVLYTIVGVIVLLIILLAKFSSVIVDFLWFKDVNYTEVFWYKFLTQLKIFGVALVISGLIFFIYSRLIKREYMKYTRVVSLKNKKQNLIINLICAISAIIFSSAAASGLWNEILMFTNSSNFNVKDPIFKHDVSFYILKLPLFQKIYAMSFGLLIFIIFITALFYFVIMSSNISYKDGAGNQHLNFSKDMIKPILQKFSVFFVLFFILIAIGYQLNSYGILLSSFGSVVGAGYIDVFISKPFYTILAIFAVISGIVTIIAIYRKKYKVVAVVLSLFVGLNILKPIAESAVQGLVVNANEVAKESKYIKNNISYTRSAYGLDNLKEENFSFNNNLSAKDIDSNKELIDNIRINDYKPALQVYNQLQGIRTYYKFNDVDVDRYNVNGKEVQMFISAREMNSDALPSSTWINTHLKYTHGYGIVMSPVNSVNSEGQPNMAVKDIPPVTKKSELKVTRPEIYFGEMSDYYAITNTSLKEFDYPSGDNNKECTYSGNSGIKLNPLNRLLFAINNNDLSFIVSGYINSNSRILLHRNIMDRVNKIAPFLKYDNDPYIVLNHGRLYWIIDGYTTSDRYPYAQGMESSLGTYNYLRNPVKVVVDAYTGKTTFYLVDKKDPIINVYVKLFKNMFKDVSQMPAGLREHIRYPQILFDSQAEILRRYHVSNSQVFYNNEDTWNLAEQDSTSVESSYLHMKLPGEKSSEFTIMMPYTPRSKQNLVSWLCGRMDDNNYGKLVLYKLPKQELCYGPSQVEGMINQEPSISKELTLWGQQGSKTYRGNVLIVPVEKSLLYVQPLYITSSSGASIPELKRVIVVYKDSIVMEPTINQALAKIFGQNVTSNGETNNLVSGGKVNISDATVKGLIQDASSTYDNAINAQKAGNWAEYGVQINNLKAILNKLKAK